MTTAAKITEEGILGRLYQAYSEQVLPPWVPQVSAYVESNELNGEEYGWLMNPDGPREWTGGRQAQTLEANEFYIRNRTFESTLSIPRPWIDFDKTGQIDTAIQTQVQKFARHWRSLTSEAIKNGTSGICYDGNPFFSDSHEVGDSGVQSNIKTIDVSTVPSDYQGTPDAPSPATMEYAILKTIESMMDMVDGSGDLVNEDARSFVVMAPTHYMSVVISALKADQFAGGEDNTINYGGFNIGYTVNPDINNWGNSIAIFRTDASVPSLIRQEREGLEVSTQGAGSYIEHQEKRWEFGLSAVRNVGYGRFEMAAKANLN